ncbi:hypothetical protein EMIT0210MI2_12313 [Priestia megaterium]
MESKASYDAPKIHKTLFSNGFYLSLTRVQRLIGNDYTCSITKKKYRAYPSKEKVVQLNNLLKRDSLPGRLMKVGADITYISTLKDGRCYLASVLDLHSK